MNLDFIKIVGDLGATGITAGALWLVYKLVTNHSTHTDKVIEKNTDAWIENSKALTHLADVIKMKK